MNNNIEEEEFYQEMREFLVTHINVVFLEFQKESQVPEEYYGLNIRLAIVAITNAVSDIRRSASYHSTTGPCNYKIAGFSGRWVAHHRPIWIDYRRFSSPDSIDLSIDLEQINADFAVFFIQSLTDKRLDSKFAHDLSYCFEFRNPSGDEVAMLLELALK